MEKRKKERFSFKRALGLEVPAGQLIVMDSAVMHITSTGRLEIENCGGILDYNETGITLKLGCQAVRIEGDGLLVDTYQKALMTVHGRIFTITFLYSGAQGAEV